MLNIHEASKLLFSIPIYVRSLKEWHEDYLKKEKEYLDRMEKNWERAGAAMPSSDRSQHQVWFNQSAQLWQYNEIIGFIEIRCHGGFLYGFLFKSPAKRYSPSLKNKRIELDLSFEPPSFRLKENHNMNIQHLVSQIVKIICRQNKRLRRCFIDTEIVENILPILDGEKLLRTCSTNTEDT